ncbi:MAG TPA: hypothetical protein VK899_06770, partial [Gemmatimonadales bacterium]|nr:hypothetical protein [Gemmatimonadales bacterium]
MLTALGALVDGRVRLWRADQRSLRVAAGDDPGWSLTLPTQPGLTNTTGGQAWLQPVPGAPGVWLDLADGDPAGLERAAQRVSPVVGALLESERQRAYVADELAGRYE